MPSPAPHPERPPGSRPCLPATYAELSAQIVTKYGAASSILIYFGEHTAGAREGLLPSSQCIFLLAICVLDQLIQGFLLLLLILVLFLCSGFFYSLSQCPRSSQGPLRIRAYRDICTRSYVEANRALSLEVTTNAFLSDWNLTRHTTNENWKRMTAR